MLNSAKKLIFCSFFYKPTKFIKYQIEKLLTKILRILSKNRDLACLSYSPIYCTLLYALNTNN